MSNLATITNNILADSGIDDINVIVSTGSYANPAWITSLAWTKITGAPSNIVTGTGTTNTIPRFTGSSTIGDSGITDNGSTIVLGRATSTLAAATEANSITITQPSFTTDQPVKLLNFNWYDEPWSIGNIRSSASPSNGLGVFATGVEKVRFKTDALLLQNINLQFRDNPSIRWSSNFLNLKNTDSSIPVIALRANGSNNQAPRLDMYNAADDTVTISLNGASGTGVFSSSLTAVDYRFNTDGYITYDTINSGTATFQIRKFGTNVLSFNASNQASFVSNVVLSGKLGVATGNPRTRAEFVSGLPAAIPTFTDTTNGIAVTDGGAIYGRLGVSNFSAIGGGYPTYIQGGDYTAAIYYNLLLNPLGANVGIGTTNPIATLDVNGTARFSNTATATLFSAPEFYNATAYPYNTVFGSGADATTTKIRAGSTYGYESYVNMTSANLILGTGSLGRLIISSTGLATFSSLLRVEGQYVQIVNSTNPSLYINNTVVQWQNYVKSNNNIAFSDAVRDVLTLGYNGSDSFFQGCNVGINRTNPVSRLEVSSESEGTAFTGITVSNWALNQSRAGIAFKAYDWVQSAIWHGRGISGNLGGALVLGTNPDTANLTVGGVLGRMWIFNNGNTSVGSEVDNGGKFQVNGNVNVSNGSVFAGLGGPATSRGFYAGSSGFQASFLYNNTTGNLDISPRAGYNTIFTEGDVTTYGTLWVISGKNASARFYGEVGFDGGNRFYITNNAYIYGRNNLILTGRLDAGNDGYSFGSNGRNSLVFNSNDGGAQGSTGTEYMSIQLQLVTKALYIQTKDNSDNGRVGTVFFQSGNVSFGSTTDNGAKLQVNGDIRTGALDGGYVSGYWKLGRALIGTQPSETYQIIVEINGQLFAIGAALI